MSWNIQKPGDYINGDLTVTNNITTNSEIYSLGGRLALYRTAGASYIDWSSGQNLVWRTVTSVGGGGAANQMFLNSTGLGIGAIPGYKLDILATGASTISGSFNVARITGASAVANDLSLVGPNTSQVRINFSDTDSNGVGEVGYDHATNILRFVTNNSQKGCFNSTGAFVLAGGNVNANGVGIAFPSAQSASTDANTLDDYEEGVWTATLRGGTSEPANLAQNTARYTKIGRQVTVHVAFENIDTTGYAGPIRISGLPFANSAIRTMGSAGTFLGSTFSETQIVALTASDTALEFMDIKSNAVWTASTHFTGSGRYFWATLTYTVA